MKRDRTSLASLQTAMMTTAAISHVMMTATTCSNRS